MFGRKMDLFFTDFSFLGWMLLQNILVNAVASGVYALAGDGVLYTVITLAATTACAMFLTTYTSLTEAGFYLFVLGNQRPERRREPVERQRPERRREPVERQ